MTDSKGIQESMALVFVNLPLLQGDDEKNINTTESQWQDWRPDHRGNQTVAWLIVTVSPLYKDCWLEMRWEIDLWDTNPLPSQILDALDKILLKDSISGLYMWWAEWAITYRPTALTVISLDFLQVQGIEHVITDRLISWYTSTYIITKYLFCQGKIT